MPSSDIHFFTPQDNAAQDQPRATASSKAAELTGYISPSGKLTLPRPTLEQLGIDPQVTAFRVGTEAGKRRIKILYLIPADETATDAFTMGQGAKSRFIELKAQLISNGLDLATDKYSFTVSPFPYQGRTGYALKLNKRAGKVDDQPKALSHGAGRRKRRPTTRSGLCQLPW